ncbi:mitochondrial 18 KDa protein-domain-containing protein [Lasiosphaeria miniovina]|uniref:Mitochondrial fission process protein 1 n=1 Tax=Lasiosphaeria miniovina TaxID=1954250 RepID=A0AA39ZR14_9PEZI|nr:mitochondrial 18 KDa protein-domain-containing protein [Lasiosphaeria miniovina]KAK0702038.1 mitochondrial 18 KDa protein-domain-containing protein [Lasiosphaeria miniovina]
MVWPWSKSSDAPTTPAKDSPPQAKPAPSATLDVKKETGKFDPDKLPEREKLPPKLQSILDKDDREDNFFDELVEGYVPPSTESNVRYAAYAARFRTILVSAHRYVAYTSDIGESFRPVAHPWMVRGAYGISWAYILGDVGYEGYKAYLHNERVRNPQLELTERQQKLLGLDLQEDAAGGSARRQLAPGVVPPLEDYRTVMLQRGIFQSLASMGLPAFTIHSVVRYSGRALKDVKNKTIRTYGPIGLGLAVVPFLPTLFDKPVENAVEWTFHKAFESVGGHEAVGAASQIGREKQLSERPREKKPKEKDL